MVAWGHTNEHWLHWMQFFEPVGDAGWPRRAFRTGRWPCREGTVFGKGRHRHIVTLLGQDGANDLVKVLPPVDGGGRGISAALAQAAGTAISTRPSMAMSTASMFILTEGHSHSMVGVFNWQMTARLQRFGYCNVSYNESVTRAHEFHRSRIVPAAEEPNYIMSYQLTKPEKNKSDAVA